MKNRYGFTFIELMVVVVLVGIITAFALPSFKNAKEHAEYLKLRNNLVLIHGALQIYKARNGDYPSTAGDLTQINTMLGLHIVDDDNSYTYFPPSSGWVSAVRDLPPADLYEVRLWYDQPINGGTNPRCVPLAYCPKAYGGYYH